MWTRSISLLELYSYDQVIQNNGSTISSFLFKSSSEFLICCTFKNSSSSLFCYTFASHACNLGSHTTFFLSFDSFQVTIQHDTIIVHENCWDNFKSSPRLLHFYVILKQHMSHHNFSCHAGYKWHKCQKLFRHAV